MSAEGLMPPPPNERLQLPTVTLCAVSSVNVLATLRALKVCLQQVAFADCILLTDALVESSHPEIRVMPIGQLQSSTAYSDFILSTLVDYLTTSHCLVAQWDGHILDAQHWRPEFLHYDYIGASWPQFTDGYDVGNGGFSLRSRRLMELCRDPEFVHLHPEDIAIGRTNRGWLEERGMRFAPRSLADLFSAERAGDAKETFGYHGVWNMPLAIGVDAFWQVYRELDDRRTLHRDFLSLLMDVWPSKGGAGRIAQMIKDRLF